MVEQRLLKLLQCVISVVRGYSSASTINIWPCLAFQVTLASTRYLMLPVACDAMSNILNSVNLVVPMAIRTAIVCVATRQEHQLGCHHTCFPVFSDQWRERKICR